MPLIVQYEPIEANGVRLGFSLSEAKNINGLGEWRPALNLKKRGGDGTA